ncbi:MAG: hypothetical protein QM696_10365 [Steroidobacteraceae bacterium]
MSGSRWFMPALALWAMAAAAAAASGPAGPKPAETRMLEQQACLGPAEQFTRMSADHLRVICPDHTTLAGLPALYVTECGRFGRRWRCNRAVLAVRAPVGARTVLLTPQGGSFATARDVARVLVEYPWHFNGRNLAEMLQGLCAVEDLGTGAFAGARDYRVRCAGRGVVVTRACAGQACRMFPARWDDA